MKNHEALCQNHKCARKDNCKRYHEVLPPYRFTFNYHHTCDKHNNYISFREKEIS